MVTCNKEIVYEKMDMFVSCDVIIARTSKLLVENDMATVRQITDVIESRECNSLWSKYTNFKEERPKLFEY